MKKYEAVIILNPNLSSKVDEFKKDFDKLLTDNSFKTLKTEDVGRRQLAYSIANHNKGHYILFNLEGEPSKLLEIETKIKYNESIIRHLFLVVKVHNGEDSSLLIESKNKKPETVEIEEKKEVKTEKPKIAEEDSPKEEAEETIAVRSEQHGPCHTKQVGDRWVVYRTSDDKVMKSINYFAPNLEQFFTKEEIQKAYDDRTGKN